jgi:hypothetical protein
MNSKGEEAPQQHDLGARFCLSLQGNVSRMFRLGVSNSAYYAMNRGDKFCLNTRCPNYTQGKPDPPGLLSITCRDSIKAGYLPTVYPISNRLFEHFNDSYNLTQQSTFTLVSHVSTPAPTLLLIVRYRWAYESLEL